MKVLVLGASGMIGNAMFRILSESKDLQVFGTVRSEQAKRFFSQTIAGSLVAGVDVNKDDELINVFTKVRPNLIINCIGLTKHHKEADAPLFAIPINALFPHRLAELCAIGGSRLIHVSTDCIFSGARGNYKEYDLSDAIDVYGKTKFLGEVNYPHAITLRTSTIGHELQSRYGLLEWFLFQRGQCNGFSRAIFSGLPNTIFAKIVRDFVIPRDDLAGLYHVGANPISKYDLLCLISKVYCKSININKYEDFVIDRSLNTEKFNSATGYVAPCWSELIESMYKFK